ncbi:(2Fe-2S)-binding protein [Rugamonas sp. FT82W]|uniref:(2Fe-2S)-binding protein n=1 Tax=Duganella vulcania TaxID=2692166 RepID=A0A845GDW3_9BURK|nr:(2Fe-2S)-binding protein [Duganella vulcania]MYM91027.1 (2Fe-2S)-binding protein [Duganella vulcania]
MSARFVRLAETARPQVHFSIDGVPATALLGDTVLVAMLNAARSLRGSEFDPGRRAGFCLMGACQDCWVWTAQGQRLRACSTDISEGLQIITRNTEAAWLNPT